MTGLENTSSFGDRLTHQFSLLFVAFYCVGDAVPKKPFLKHEEFFTYNLLVPAISIVWLRRAPFEELGTLLYWGCGPIAGLSGAYAAWKLGPYTIFKLYPEGYGAGLNLYWKGWRVLGLDWHQWHIRQDLKTGKPLHPRDQYALNRPHIDLPLWEYHHWPWTQLPHSSEVAAVKAAKDEKRAAKAEKKAEKKARREIQLALRAATKQTGEASPDTSTSPSPPSSTASTPATSTSPNLAPPSSPTPTLEQEREFAETLLHGFPASTSFDDLGVLLGDENDVQNGGGDASTAKTLTTASPMAENDLSTSSAAPASPMHLLYQSSEPTHRKIQSNSQEQQSLPAKLVEPSPQHPTPSARPSKFVIPDEEPPIDGDVLG